MIAAKCRSGGKRVRVRERIEFKFTFTFKGRLRRRFKGRLRRRDSATTSLEHEHELELNPFPSPSTPSPCFCSRRGVSLTIQSLTRQNAAQPRRSQSAAPWHQHLVRAPPARRPSRRQFASARPR